MMLGRLAEDARTEIDCDWVFTRDAFVLDVNSPLVAAFQSTHTGISGQELPLGAKPFVDDGNSFWSLAHARDHTRPPRWRSAHRQRMGVDRRPRTGRVAVRRDGRLLLAGREE